MGRMSWRVSCRYFFALWPPLYLAVRWANNKLFNLVEWMWYR
jgi:hypothetical protein